MYQKLIIIGTLTRDPEMRYMADGTAVTNLSLATNRRWTNPASGQQVDETTWFRVTIWRRQAETANQYLSKGSKVLIEGRITPDPKTGNPRIFTRQDGTVGASYEVTAETVRFLSARGEASSGGGFGDEGGSGGSEHEADDIPF